MANLIDRFLRRNNEPKQPEAVKAGGLTAHFQWWPAGADTNNFMFADTPLGRIEAAHYNVWAANCISARAETIASVPLKLYRRSKDDQQEDEEVSSHPVLDLLESVNPINLDKASFREQIERQLSIHGDCYIQKVRANGKPVELYILPAQHVYAIPDERFMVAGYQYLGIRRYNVNDVVRIYYVSDRATIEARSPMSSAINSVNNYNLADLAQRSIDKRGGQGGGIISFDFNALRNDPERFMAAWDAQRSDPRNAGRDAFLPHDAKYQSGVLTAQQQQREERLHRLIKEIMAALRVPPALAGDYKDASVLANAAQQSKNFWETFVLYELQRIEEAFNSQLLWLDWPESREDGLYLRHDVSGVPALAKNESEFAARLQALAAAADTAFSASMISLNEARAWINEEPIDDPRANEVLQPELPSGEPEYENEEEVEEAEEVEAGEAGEAKDVALQEEVNAIVKEIQSLKADDDEPKWGRGSNQYVKKPRDPSSSEDSPSRIKRSAIDAAFNKRGSKKKKKKKTAEEKEKERAERKAQRERQRALQYESEAAQLQKELDRITAMGDAFKDESNLRKRIAKAIDRLRRRAQQLRSGSETSASTQQLLDELASKSLPPYENADAQAALNQAQPVAPSSGVVSGRVMPFIDVVGAKAILPNGAQGVVESVKRFGVHDGFKASPDDPVAYVRGEAHKASTLWIVLEAEEGSND